MTISIPPRGSLLRACPSLVSRVVPATIIALCSTLMQAAPAPAQVIDESLPTVVSIGAPDPACASSANGSSHIICVFASGSGMLSAASVLVKAGAFASPALDTVTVRSTGPNNPLSLGVTGTVGNSSCSSAADGSGDVVCAFNASGTMKGLRFNIFADPQPSPTVVTLGTADSAAVNASCAIGAPRFTVTAPAAGVAGEGPAGDTICAFRGANNELMGVAFNPTVGASSVVLQDLQVVATADPSCANPPDQVVAANDSNQVLCAFTNANGLDGIAFDPRTAFRSGVQSLYSGTSFIGTPSCAAVMQFAFQNNTLMNVDTSGDALCAIMSSSGTLQGFAFNPRTSFQSALQSLSTTAVTGTPSCSGLQASATEVICTVNSATSNNKIVEFVEFDPRSGTSSGLSFSGVLAESNVSCTFQNANSDQLSCAGFLPSANEMFVFIPSTAGVVAGPNQSPPVAIPPALPSLRTNVSQVTSGGSVTLSWTTQADATSYKIYETLCNPASCAQPQPVGQLIATVASPPFPVTITRNTLFQVQSCNASGCNTGSETVGVAATGPNRL